MDNNQDTERNTSEMPGRFETLLGKAVRCAGRNQGREPFLIFYEGSGHQCMALPLDGEADLNDLLKKADRLYDSGFLEDENGIETDTILLPVDGYDLSRGRRGLIADCDLRSYLNGYAWLLDPEYVRKSGADAKGALKSVISFLQTLLHLQKKGLTPERLDGHQLYFNAAYGFFRYLYDFRDMKEKGEEKEAAEKLPSMSISAMILRLLTGAWPAEYEDPFLGLTEEEERFLYLDMNGRICGYAPSMECMEILPEEIRKALVKGCLEEPEAREILSPEEWEKILQKEEDQTQACIFCGKHMFVPAASCPFCGSTTIKEDLMTRWLIERKDSSYRLRISFGRGTVLTGEILGIPCRGSAFMKIVYKAGTNTLGIRNMSGIVWTVMTDREVNELLPGQAAPVTAGMRISFAGHPEAAMRFLGYENR